jgi:neurofibromin 1
MAAREPLEWHFKQLDHTVGLSFKVQYHLSYLSSEFLTFNHVNFICRQVSILHWWATS